MALRVREKLHRVGARGLALVATLAGSLCSAGCSFDLSNLTPGSGKELPPPEAPAAALAASDSRTNPKESQLHAGRAQTLAQAGKTDEALAEFNIALDLDPHNAKAFYNRGLLYQADKKYELAIADFTSANGLTPQQADPLLGRATCYLALGKAKEAAADLDEAVQASPQNGQLWVARGAAYEKLGARDKAAESYSRAMLLRPKDDAARSGLARMGGRAG
ncbi:MAG: tetratricopeptide repeat protein [Tardiphaga sp.]